MRPKGALLDLNLIAELVLLIVVANGAPVLAKRALGTRPAACSAMSSLNLSH